MKIIYLIVKYSTVVGTFLQAFFEHLTCRVYEVLIEDARYLRADELCGHVEHELIRKRSTALAVSFFPFLFNLIVGLVLLSVGAVNVLYLGEFFTSSGMPHFVNFLFLWMGVSVLTNLFPQIEDVLQLKDLLYGKGGLAAKIFASPIFGVLYVGAYLQACGATLLTSAAFAFAWPYILGAILPGLVG